MIQPAETLMMGGFGFYIWSAVGMTLAVLLGEVLWLRWRRQAVLREQKRWRRLAKHKGPV
ncbi:heme exporter protein CcmD [Candidatus Thiothrix sp. Deng01]|uniref:Heme exporter protein D n=1 Tax=Candidatus Thiothrix phosphatis TaxID=3112415 RepID=A0ABU6D4W5_9GAMM|nr:heme exporter protein CcmD [Candidatus Thiothrix sp. Deng01]MEB4593343.1 heme exporter protein CcmD [Candidatus Thiothrix sp. Deng01]